MDPAKRHLAQECFGQRALAISVEPVVKSLYRIAFMITHIKQHLFPTEQIAKMSEMGLMGINVSADFGGAGMSALAYAVSCEEISRGCASAGTIMSAQGWINCSSRSRLAIIYSL